VLDLTRCCFRFLGETVPKYFRLILIVLLMLVFPLTLWAQDGVDDGTGDDEDPEVTYEDVWLDADFSGYVYDLRTVNYDLPFAIGDAINGNIIISGIPNLCGVQDPAIPWEYSLTFYDDLPTITINQTDTEQGYELLQYPGWEAAGFEPLWVRISFMDMPGMTEFRDRVWITISWGFRTHEDMGPGPSSVMAPSPWSHPACPVFRPSPRSCSLAGASTTAPWTSRIGRSRSIWINSPGGSATRGSSATRNRARTRAPCAPTASTSSRPKQAAPNRPRNRGGTVPPRRSSVRDTLFHLPDLYPRPKNIPALIVRI
jgi:hypothetical protein